MLFVLAQQPGAQDTGTWRGWEYGSVGKLLASHPSPLVPGKPINTCNPNTGKVESRRWRVQGNLWSHSDFKASMNYLLPCLKKKNESETFEFYTWFSLSTQQRHVLKQPNNFSHRCRARTCPTPSASWALWTLLVSKDLFQQMLI